MKQSYDVESFRSSMLDRVKCLDLIRKSAGFKNCVDTTHLAWSEAVINSNVDAIHSFTESPIEVILFATLAWGLATRDPGALMVIPWMPDDPVFQSSESVYSVWPWVKNCVHLKCQPTISAQGFRPMRPDAMVWVPTKKHIKPLIIECDSFQFHSSKESFVNDRQRDRALASIGYDVTRYSGSEIFRDPLHAAGTLANRIYGWYAN